MARFLADWAGENGWQGIEANAYEDVDILYQVTGQAGRAFWEKLGYHVSQIGTEPGLEGDDDFARAVRERVAARGLPPATASRRYTMRLDLGQCKMNN